MQFKQRNSGLTHRRVSLFILAITLIVTLWPHVANGQSTPGDVQDVFLNRSADPTAPDTLYFVSTLTGLSSVYTVSGSGYSLISGGVLYRDQQTQTPTLISPTGQITPIAYMAAPPVQIAAWAVSADQAWIAWVETHTEVDSLLSDLYLARSDGSEKRLALHTSSPLQLVTIPVAISLNGRSIVYTRQTIPATAPVYFDASDVSIWTTDNNATAHLSSEPLCACAAATSADGKTVFRLDKHFTAHFIDPTSGADLKIAPPAELTGTVAGDVLIESNGALAVYSFATSADPRVARYGVAIADAVKQVQRVLLPPGTVRFQPIAFEQDSLLLAAVNRNGTFRIPLSGGNPVSISADSYLGTIGS